MQVNVPVGDLLEFLRTHPHKGFKPVPHRNHDGRSITWYWKDERAFSEPIHYEGRWVGSVHKSLKTGEVVGVTIHEEAIK